MKWLTVLVVAIAIAGAVIAALLYAAGGSAGGELPPGKDHDHVHSTYIP